MLSQTPWLTFPHNDMFACYRDIFVVCGEGIEELFDIPDTATRIRLSIHSRPSKLRVKMYVPKHTSERVIFDADFAPIVTHYAARKLKPYCGRTVYLECEYKE